VGAERAGAEGAGVQGAGVEGVPGAQGARAPGAGTSPGGIGEEGVGGVGGGAGSAHGVYKKWSCWSEQAPVIMEHQRWRGQSLQHLFHSAAADTFPAAPGQPSRETRAGPRNEGDAEATLIVSGVTHNGRSANHVVLVARLCGAMLAMLCWPRLGSARGERGGPE